LSRNGTDYFATGQTAGVFPVSSGDRILVTYTVAPSLAFMPL
jgi:hypothetical protein